MSEIGDGSSVVPSVHESQMFIAPSPHELELADWNSFMKSEICNKENLNSCLHHLSKELEVLGFLSQSSNNQSQCEVDLTALVNAVYELIHVHRRNAHRHEELENKYSRCSSDMEHLQGLVARLRENIHQKEKEIGLIQERERQTFEKTIVFQNKLKVSNDEVKRLNSVIQHRDAQFRHEMRKRELETNKLKDKLRQLLMERGKERRTIGMEILNPLQRHDGSRGKWKTDASSHRNEEDMYCSVLKNLEERNGRLTAENQELCETLASTCCDQDLVLKLIESNHGLDEDENLIELNCTLSTNFRTSSDGFPKEFFHMPYHIIRPKVEKCLNDKWQQLKEWLNRLNSDRGGNLGDCTEGSKDQSTDTINVHAVPSLTSSEEGISTPNSLEKVLERDDQSTKLTVHENLIDFIKSS